MSPSAGEMGAGTAATALGWGRGSAASVGDEQLVARSLATVGSLGLVSLPLLLTASPLLNAPVGAPAAIALGYLAAAWSLHFGRNGSAAAWSWAVHGGLVLWTVLYSALAPGTMSWAGLAAVLLAPLFAAAPAVVRRALAREQARVPNRDERLADSRPSVEIQPGQLEPATGDRSSAVLEAALEPARPEPSCDFGAAIAFGLRRIEAAMRAKDICLLRQQSSSLAVAGDARLFRQIVTALLEGALGAAPAGGTVKVEARNLKGVVLFRVTIDGPAQRHDLLEQLAASLARTRLHSLVDDAGGTMLTGWAGQGASATLRLASSPGIPAECSAKYAGGA